MSKPILTQVILFPFDQFGNSGTAAGAELLFDYVTELLDDNSEETRPTRSTSYDTCIGTHEVTFPHMKALQSWKSTGKQTVRHVLKGKQRVLWLGGNHLSVLPVYEELGADTVVFQFDAHLDVYQLHDVSQHPANGNFLLHADGPLPTIVNVGHRDLFLPRKEIEKTFTVAYSAMDVHRDIDRIAKDLEKRAEKAKRVWIDIDVDAFDPAHAPAVHHPLPCGLSSAQVLRLLEAVFNGNVVGVSFSEFDPGRDTRDTTLNLLGWLIEWILLRWYEQSS
jgi:agmatinase